MAPFLALVLGTFALAQAPAEPVVFRDPGIGFSLRLPEGWIPRDQAPADVKARAQTTANKLSTAQAAQLKPLAEYLHGPFAAHAQQKSLRIDWIDDPSVANYGPVGVAQVAVETIKKGDSAFRVLEAPRTVTIDGHTGATFAVEHTAHYANTLAESAVSRARLWFFKFEGCWLKVNVAADKDDWAGLEKDLEKIGKDMHFEEPKVPPPAKAHDEIMDGLKF